MEPAEKLRYDLCGAIAELDASGEEVTRPRYKSVCPEIHKHLLSGSAENIDCAHFGPIVRREIYRAKQQVGVLRRSDAPLEVTLFGKQGHRYGTIEARDGRE